MRVLIVSENLTLIRNMREWYSRRINSGSLIIDHAVTTEDSKEYIERYDYDHIFHNGLYVIDAIERHQRGAEVWNIGSMNNEYQNGLDVNNKKSFSNIFNKRYLQSGVNIGGALGVVTVLVGIVTWAVTLRADVDVNSGEIGEIKSTVTEIKIDQKEMNKNVNELTTAFKYIYRDEIEKAKKITGVSND